MKKIIGLGIFAAAGLLLSGCASLGFGGQTPVVKAVYTDKAPVLDGRLEDAAWAKAPVYTPVFSRTFLKGASDEVRNFFRNGVSDPGSFQLLWDDKFLYIGIRFKDKDIVAEGLEDQLKHCSLGDLAEVFLKPDNDTYYWELYVTPIGKKTAFFYPGRGRHGLPSCLPEKIPLRKMKVSAEIRGTVNSSFDQDVEWTAELAIPLDEINARGIKLAPGVPWKILLARYNYSRYLPVKELTAFPQLERTNFHAHEEYGRLMLVK